VGVRGNRIKNIVDELGGERIDIVRWDDNLEVLIPNALQPAQISEVFTYPRLGRAIVLVTDDQLSLAIGRRGQNVRLASKLVGWDIEIMTHDELAEALERAERWFGQLPHASAELTSALIEEGFLSYNDLTCISNN
jgi:N utilization substance protein A